MDFNTLNAKDRARLQKLIEARGVEPGYIMALPADYKALIAADMAQANDQIKSGKGGVMHAIRASDAALTAWNAQNGAGSSPSNPTNANPPAAPGAAASKYKISADIAIPPLRRGFGEAAPSQYPFDSLEIGQSFHVPVSASMPDPGKSMASSVSAAKRRFAKTLPGSHSGRTGKNGVTAVVDNFELTRNFIMRSVKGDDPKTGEKGDPEGPGARIWRVELPDDPVFDAKRAERAAAAGRPADEGAGE